MSAGRRPPQLVVARDAPAEAATRIVARLQEVLDERPRATLALSGGTTPAPMLRHLAATPFEWGRVDIVQVDERVAPDGHPDRNATMIAALAPPEAVLHLMPVTASDLDAAARSYAELLARLAPDGRLDVVHLGVGDDGHTASWPPGDPVVEVTDTDVALAGPYQGRRRMTLTVPAVNRGRHRVLLVTEASKAPVVARYLDGDPDLPVTRVVGESTVVVASPDAAPGGTVRS